MHFLKDRVHSSRTKLSLSTTCLSNISPFFLTEGNEEEAALGFIGRPSKFDENSSVIMGLSSAFLLSMPVESSLHLFSRTIQSLSTIRRLP